MTNIFKCGVLLRVYTLFMAGLYSYSQLNRPDTIMYRVAHSDDTAYMAAWVMAACAVLGFIDLVINDVMPQRFVLARGLKDRHLVMMAIPLCFAIQMYAVVKYDHPLTILAFYSVYIVLIPLSVVSDIRTRYKFKVIQ